MKITIKSNFRIGGHQKRWCTSFADICENKHCMVSVDEKCDIIIGSPNDFLRVNEGI